VYTEIVIAQITYRQEYELFIRYVMIYIY